jgi:hydrogenase maturation protease
MNSKNHDNTDQIPRIVVVGVGNLLLKDEGVGIHAVKHLQEMGLPQDVELIDGGTAPDLIAYIKAGDKLVIVDAARAGGEPGTLYRLLPQDLATDSGTLASAHELGVELNLKLMSLMGNEPEEIVIIGVEPKEIDWGTELTPELNEKMPEILRAILREIGMDNREHD